MKKFISAVLSIFVLVTFANFAYAGEKEASQKKLVDNYEVELITPNPLMNGENAIKVLITKDGAPVQSIPVKIVAEMDKTDTSMEMEMHESDAIEKNLVEQSSGVYLADIDFDGEGRWNVDVTFNNNQTALFQVTVKQSGPNWVVIGGFIGIILLVAGMFAFRGRKGE